MATKAKKKPAALTPPIDGPAAAVPAPAPGDPAAPSPLLPVMPAELLGEVPLAQIRPCPFNLRQHFPEDDIAGLAASIKSEGLLARLVVRPVGLPGERCEFVGGKWSGLSHYELADGERRYRALKLLDQTHSNDGGGPTKVPVVIRPLTDAQVRAIMLVTREQSRDLKVSELVAGYADLRSRLPDDAAVAAAVGKPVGHVRSVLRLGKLPAWALAAVDAGVLPRATAELVARVPGEESRKRAAACVLIGYHDPKLCEADDFTSLEAGEYKDLEPLSYRDTKDLIRNHFTKELKGSPFSRKSLTLLPEAGSCDACPKRAGNDPEAVADGTRADTCLDPDCYRQKVKAHDAAELLKGTRKGFLQLPEDFPSWPPFMDSPPKGWCDVEAPAQLGDLSAALQGTKHGPEPLGKLLGLHRHPPGGGPAVFAAVDPKHRLRALIKTADARRLLQASGVLKKSEPAPKPKRQVDDAWLDEANKKPPSGITQEDWDRRREKPAEGTPLIAKVSEWEADGRALTIAAKVLGEYCEEQFSELDAVEDACANGPVVQMLRLVARGVAYEWLVRGGAEQLAVLRLRFPEIDGDCLNEIVTWPAARCLAFLAQLVAAVELEHGVNTETAEELLAFAELDWPQLREQARRELAGGESAEAKVAKAEAAQEGEPV